MPLPSVLLGPPWRRSRAASSRPAPSVGVPLEAARVVWEDGERERFRGPVAKPLGEDAEERLLQRLLDQIEKDRAPASTDMWRLSHDTLAEIAEEVGSQTIDVTGMRLLLAELGDEFVARAIAIVRAAPRERGLFEAMAPVRAPELAKT